MEKYSYNTRGTCSRGITFETDGNTVHNVVFNGGCNGNTQAYQGLLRVWKSVK